MAKFRRSMTLVGAAVLGWALASICGAVTAQNPPAPVALPGAPQALPPGTASVSGTVVAAGTNDPINGASVELRRIDCNNFANPPEVLTALTGPDGKFAFQNLHPGGWCVVASSAGGKYAPAEYLQRDVKGRGVTIPVGDGEKVAGIRLAMPPTGGISGRIYDSDREPMAHARVEAMEMFYQDGQRRLYILQVAQTNDLGEYRFYWLPPGRYYVAVAPEDTRRQNVTSVQPPPGAGGHREDVISPVVMRRIEPGGAVVEERYVPVYYPGESDPARATPIDLQPGRNVTGVDVFLNMARVPAFHIRGTLRNGITGEPAAGVQVRVAPRDWTATVVMPYAAADVNGNFDIPGVVSGAYVLYATASMPNPAAPAPAPAPAAAGAPIPRAPQAGGQNAATTPPVPQNIPLTGRMPVVVSGATVANQNFLLVAGTNLAGRVSMDGVAPNAVPRGFSVSLARDPDIVGTPGPQGRGAVQADGTFTLQGVGPGDYRIYVAPLLIPFQYGVPAVGQPLQNTYIKSVRMGRDDVLVNGLHIIDASAAGPLEIAVGVGGKLEGIVIDDKQQAAPGVTIALVPDPALRGRYDLYRMSTSDISGRFRMQGIPPGVYKAFAWENVDRDAWQDPEFIKAFENRGTSIDIREGVLSTAGLVAIAPARP